MGGWSGVYTIKGLNLLAKLTQGSTLEITRAVTGTGIVDTELLTTQTAVTGEKQTMNFQPATYPEPGTCKLPIFITNDGVGAGYTAHQIGLYANDPDDGEILYFIAQSTNGTDVPSNVDVLGYVGTWSFYFQYGQADNVTVTVDPANAVTTDMLEEVRVLAERGVSTPKIGITNFFDDAANLPFAGLSVYGKSTQAGTPSPSDPVAIESIGDVDLRTCGANIAHFADASDVVSGGVTWNCTNGVITAEGTTTGTSSTSGKIQYNLLGARGTFTVSGASSKISVYVAVTKNGETIWYKDQTFILDGTETQALMYCQIYGTGVEVNETIYPMLNYGNKALPWEAYKGQNITLTTPNGLCGIPVKSGGNFVDTTGQQWICDEIDLVRGVHVQRIGQLVFDGSADEIWYAESALASTLMFRIGILNSAKIGNTVGLDFMSNRFEPKLCYNTDTVGAQHTMQQFYFRIGSGMLSTGDLDGFKTWLNSNPTTVVYVLETPIETALTEDDYKTLVAYNPYTTVFNTDGADMYVDCIRDVNEAAFALVMGYREVNNLSSDIYPTETTITVADGAEYRYEDAITALTVTYPEGNFECWIKFLTGDTFTLTLPSETTYIGSIPDFAANTWYELSIKDGVAIFGEVGAGE